MTNPLFAPLQFGPVALKNRVVMSPMTRSRAIGNVPNELMATYYRQRSGAGLIVTEGTSPSPNGLGYARIPGLFNDAQVAGWKTVTDAIHGAGSRVFVQLMHTGRVTHPLNLPKDARVLAPSAIAPPGEMWTDQNGQQPFPTPEAMTEADIAHAIEEFAASSKHALRAGFDGVELHGANGYLIEQFLNTASNQRTDRWGGSVENRIRFAAAVAQASVEAIGADRVGIRLSPYGVFNGSAPDAQTDEAYLQLIERLNALGLLYIHIVDHSSMGAPPVSPALKSKLRAAFKGKYILSGGYDAARVTADLEEQRG
ncbi:MAG: alkene reductase, partial [Pseudomonadota bacterium]|nr:alkene reductase [Pseudomonadota bacterium]